MRENVNNWRTRKTILIMRLYWCFQFKSSTLEVILTIPCFIFVCISLLSLEELFCSCSYIQVLLMCSVLQYTQNSFKILNQILLLTVKLLRSRFLCSSFSSLRIYIILYYRACVTILSVYVHSFLFTINFIICFFHYFSINYFLNTKYWLTSKAKIYFLKVYSEK